MVVLLLVGRMNFFRVGRLVLKWFSWVFSVLMLVVWMVVWLGMYSLLLRLNSWCWIVVSNVCMLFGSVIVSSMFSVELVLFMVL